MDTGFDASRAEASDLTMGGTCTPPAPECDRARSSPSRTPSSGRRLITVAVVFSCVFSHAASEAGYVILIPLAAAMLLAGMSESAAQILDASVTISPAANLHFMAGFIALSGFINLFTGSASARWAIRAPVFVPMIMLLGYHLALMQAVFSVLWTLLMVAWMLLGLPVGPDGPLHYGGAIAP